MSNNPNKAIVEKMWQALSETDWEDMKACMHEIKDGLVYRWSDYWDMQKFVGQFPAWFLEEMMKSTAADFTD